MWTRPRRCWSWSTGSWPTTRARRAWPRCGRCSGGCPCCARRSTSACSARCPSTSRTRSPPAAIAEQPRLHAATALSVVLRGGEPEPAVVGAAHVLEMSSLTPTLETIPLALMTLFYADRTEQVDAWCTTLLEAARERNIPTWDALLSSLRAANLIR